MRKAHRLFALTVTAMTVTAAILAPDLRAEQLARQSVELDFSTERARSAAGTSLKIDWVNPNDPNGKPYAVASFTVTFHRGTRFDQGAIPICSASDLDLMARGVAACPETSRVSSGTLVTDTGSPGVIPRFGENVLTSFNADGGLITLAESSDPPTRVVGHATISDRTITVEVPRLPGSPPPDPYLAFKHFELAGEPKRVGERTFLRTPKCPPRGYWTNHLAFRYHDETEQALVTRTPCRPRRAR